MCRLKAKAGKVVEYCSSLVSRKCEYSKSFSKTKYLNYKFVKCIENIDL